jgi:hypothetical protein
LTVMSPTQCACNAGRQPPLRHRRGGPGHRQQRCPRAADLRGRDLAYLGNSPDSRRVARLPRLPHKGLPRPESRARPGSRRASAPALCAPGDLASLEFLPVRHFVAGTEIGGRVRPRGWSGSGETAARVVGKGE